jgi:hypothetical protein
LGWVLNGPGVAEGFELLSYIPAVGSSQDALKIADRAIQVGTSGGGLRGPAGGRGFMPAATWMFQDCTGRQLARSVLLLLLLLLLLQVVPSLKAAEVVDHWVSPFSHRAGWRANSCQCVLLSDSHGRHLCQPLSSLTA